MSIDASGSLAKSIVFSKWRGRNYVRRHAIPSNPRSGPQLAARSIVAYLAPLWATLSPAEKATWDTLAAATNVSAFNAYVAFNARNWRDLMAPTIEYPAAKIQTPPVMGVVSCTVLARQVQVSALITTPNDIAAIAIMRSLVADPATIAETVYISTDTVDPCEYVDGPLDVALYYYNVIGFTADGVLGAVGTGDTANVV